MRTTLTAILDERADRRPERLLYSFHGGDGGVRESYSYCEFVRRSNFIAGQLKKAGVSRGDVVLLIYPPGLEVMVAFFACARIGAIPAPAPAPVRARRHPSWTRYQHIAEQASATHVLSTSSMIARSATASPPPVDPVDLALGAGTRWIATDTLTGECDAPGETPSEVLFLQYTSGSTSMPRGVAVTHENVIHNVGLFVDHDSPVFVSWLPHFHDLGLVGNLLAAVAGGGTAHLISQFDFMRRPALWLQLITDYRATLTAAPNGAYEYCLREDKLGETALDAIDLSSLRGMFNTAEPIRPDTFEQFFRRFARCGLRRSAYFGGYGLAEHTITVTTHGRRHLRPGTTGGTGRLNVLPSHAFVSCGRPASDVIVRIVDPETRRPVADGEIGEIWADSPSKAAGYWRLPDLSRQRFEASIAGDAEGRGYLRTGDLGFFDDGELFVCGRLSDMIICGGRNVFPNDIEALLERAVPALTGHVVAFGVADATSLTETLVVLIEAADGVVDLRHVGHRIQFDTEVTLGAVARVPRGSIVRTSSGKVARQQCRELWQSGAIRRLETASFGEEELRTGSPEAIVEGLAARAGALGEPDPTLEQLGLDSIALVNLSLRLEELVEAQGLDTTDLMEQVADLSLLQALRISDLRNGLCLLNAAPSGIAALPKVFNEAAGSVRRREEAQMLADTRLPLPDSGLGAGDDGSILITGATGFLGGFLARSLIELTEAPIIALVRCETASHGVARIRQALLDTDMAPAAVTAAIACRLKVVPGDVSRSRFGLSDETWDALSESVGSIYHCAAEVDYVKSYGLLRGANVLGTREIIRLASERRGKSLHYVSTTFVHGWSTKRVVYESDVDQPIEDLDFGYSQSKWVAEQLVLRARRGGLPATIYRPSLVTASASARFVDYDIVARVVGYMLRHGLTIDTDNQVSFLPADICARNIVAISRAPSAAPILHMTVDDYYRMADVCSAISDIFGYRFDCVSLGAFVRHAHAHCAETDPLYPLLSFLDRNAGRILRMGDKRYDSCEYRRARASAPLAIAHTDLHATVDPIVRYLIKEGLVPAAPFAAAADAIEAAE